MSNKKAVIITAISVAVVGTAIWYFFLREKPVRAVTDQDIEDMKGLEINIKINQ